jgi:hypothetical protein
MIITVLLGGGGGHSGQIDGKKQSNGRESAVNRALDGSTYPG